MPTRSTIPTRRFNATKLQLRSTSLPRFTQQGDLRLCRAANMREDGDMATIDPSRTEHGGLTLPQELIEKIVYFACRHPAGTSPAPHIDYRAVLAISLVSKRLNEYAASCLYTHVRLHKPSDLLLYAQTMSSRPALGRLTESLWIGECPETSVATSWWPLNEQRKGFRSSITKLSELPRGMSAGMFWPLKQSDDDALWLNNDVAKVVQQACQSVGPPGPAVGIDLSSRSYKSFGGLILSPDEWYLRLLEVQQTLDDHFRQQRMNEDCTTLMQVDQDLEIIPDSMGPLGRRLRTVSRNSGSAGSRHRSLREDEAFDDFDHPMIYFRSGAAKLLTIDGPLFTHARLLTDITIEGGGHTDSLDVFSTRERHARVCNASFEDTQAADPTIGSLLATTRAVLASTPYLTSLGVTSYLERAVVGQRPTAAPDCLRILSLGPPTCYWNKVSCFSVAGEFRALETLHVSGEVSSERTLCNVPS
ncbi:hypothetical protein BCV69DRAFT_86605 [Microstroma glucosiphilum]|uniref:F-box domain-containing protein n=1 Tax=Pseudomicrostroma glucosiphilum TaxID=1684307 RepID=A0A316TYB5_9BASI|nr:hypothetical protein BCV69DRAFT_86605 [Pseudomicrostroma glucosiphilum]PWN18157.1 hypothetical protein BCV69DRAFT_86605 [Pseudomicrostroma glucosiphilum]